MQLTERLELFKIKFESEESRKRWRVFYKEDFDDEKVEGNTVYFVLTGEKNQNKQKSVDFSIFYTKSSSRNMLLEFRDEVMDFIKYLQSNLETPNFRNIDNSYNVEYSTIIDRAGIRVAEIKCSFDNTKEVLDVLGEEEYELMEKLQDRYIID